MACRKVQRPVTPVSWNCPESWKASLQRFAVYFRREFHYSFLQYEATGHSSDQDVHAYLFPDRTGHRWVGSCCFRKRTEVSFDYWALQWVWFHPEYRSQGTLGQAWPSLEYLNGPFVIEEPVSIEMQFFLLRKGVPESRVEGGYAIKLVNPQSI